MIQEGVSVCVITELVEASGAVEREVDRAVEQAADGYKAEPRPDQQAAIAGYERLVVRVARAGHRRLQARFLLIRLLSATPQGAAPQDPTGDGEQTLRTSAASRQTRA